MEISMKLNMLFYTMACCISAAYADHTYNFYNFTRTPVIRIDGVSYHIGSQDTRFSIPGIKKNESKSLINNPWWKGISRFIVRDPKTNGVLCEVDKEHLPAFQSGTGLGASIPLEGRFGSYDVFILPKSIRNTNDQRCIIKMYPAEDNSHATRTCTVYGIENKKVGTYRVFSTDYPGYCSCDEKGNPYSSICEDSRNLPLHQGLKTAATYTKYIIEEILKNKQLANKITPGQPSSAPRLETKQPQLRIEEINDDYGYYYTENPRFNPIIEEPE